MAIMVAIGMMGSVFAYFEDSAVSNTNSFKTGTTGLQIWDDGNWDPDGFADTVDRTWEMTNMVPGITQVTNWIMLQETGTLNGNHIEISFSNSIEPSPPLIPQDMAEWLEITSWQYNYSDLFVNLTSIPGWDVNGNGFLDLDDVERSAAINAPGGPLDNLSAPRTVGGYSNMHMTIKFNSGATNDVQGATLTLVVTFTLEQSSTQ